MCEEKQKLWKQHISEARKTYYKNHKSALAKPIKLQFLDKCLYFSSLKEASEYLQACVDTVRKFAKSGKEMKKRHCFVSYVSIEEFNLNKNV